MSVDFFFIDHLRTLQLFHHSLLLNVLQAGCRLNFQKICSVFFLNVKIDFFFNFACTVCWCWFFVRVALSNARFLSLLNSYNIVSVIPKLFDCLKNHNLELYLSTIIVLKKCLGFFEKWRQPKRSSICSFIKSVWIWLSKWFCRKKF